MARCAAATWPGNAFASTLVIVSGFTRPEFKVEVEVTAAKVDQVNLKIGMQPGGDD